jgi:hypothetical protein
VRRDAIEPEEILSDLVGLDPHLRVTPYWGERSIFYNPGDAAPLGVIVASVKDHDGDNDRSAKLDRDGVYRFALGISRETYVERFGEIPARPPKGGVVALPDYDPTRLGLLMPHPVYAWMCWLQILSPSAGDFDALRPLVAEALDLARNRWRRRLG